MHPGSPRNRTLFLALLATLIATLAHFVDNSVNVSTYPEPPSLTPLAIMSAWVGLSMLGSAGYIMLNSRRVAGALALYLYALLAAGGLAHYFYGPLRAFTPKMHVLIAAEFLAALGLVIALTRHLADRGARY